MEGSMALGTNYQKLRCTRACTPNNIIFNYGGCVISLWACATCKFNCILQYIICNRYFSYQVLEEHYFLSVKYLFQSHILIESGSFYNLYLIFICRVIYPD